MQLCPPLQRNEPEHAEVVALGCVCLCFPVKRCGTPPGRCWAQSHWNSTPPPSHPQAVPQLHKAAKTT